MIVNKKCLSCKNMAAPDKSRCQVCLDKYKVKYYLEKNSGKCRSCDNNVVIGKAWCQSCLDDREQARKERHQTKREAEIIAIPAEKPTESLRDQVANLFKQNKKLPEILEILGFRYKETISRLYYEFQTKKIGKWG